uniref:Tyrosine-protein phosphatase domain-containing protein n=1 Tax=Amphilophus citrinellus TaxID=61819 RepID=A0A3Q0RYA9_AMPCI
MGNGIIWRSHGVICDWMQDARDRELLAQHNITHILSIHDTAAPVLEVRPPFFTYFRDSIVFIHESAILGVSRSVTLVVAYIMTVTGRGWVESLAAVRSVRPCAGPNLGFLRQLEEFENTELTEYRAWWKELYGKNVFNDDEEIEALLTRKATISDAVSTSISK